MVYDNKREKLKKITMFIILLFLGVSGNYFKIQLFMGADLVFGTIFVLIMLKFYGLRWAVTGSLITSSYTYRLWNNPYGILLYTLEILFIGLMQKRKNKNIILLSSIYWVLIAMPLQAVMLHILIKLNSTEAYLIILKNAINGILNAYIANLIILLIPIIKNYAKGDRNINISVNQIFFNMFLGAVIISNLFVSITNNNDRSEKIWNNIKLEAQSKGSKNKNNINTLIKQYINSLSSLANKAKENQVNYSKELEQYLKVTKEANIVFDKINICNSKGELIASYPKTDQNKKLPDEFTISYKSNFEDVKLTSVPYISNMFTEIESKNPMVTIGVPIIKDNKFIGAVMAELNLNYFNNMLTTLNANLDGNMMAILDGNNIVISSNEKEIKSMEEFIIDEGIIPNKDIYIELPNWRNIPLIQVLKKAYYIYESPIGINMSWKLVVGIPIAHYQQELVNCYTKNLSIILTSILLTLLIATSLSRLISCPIKSLAKVTTHLPDKILKEDSIEWPTTIIKEIDLLINNFKSTSQILKNNFKEIQTANNELKYLANHDPLTRLPNRIKFNKELNNALKKANEINSQLAVLFLDLDRFKLINDTFGHDVGDKLLIEISNRLIHILEKNDVVCRIGGDEFTIMIPTIENIEQVSSIAKRILKTLQETYIIDGQEFSVSTSIGISIFPQDGTDSQELLKKADIAMYRGKENGKNIYQFYREEMDIISVERFKFENSLRKALEQEEFILYYQPRVEAETDRIIAVEALIRWNNPSLGMVSPAEFIPLAEETGLIVPIGEWVLRTACKQNKQWQEAGYDPIRVSVNLSAMQFTQQDLVEKIKSILEETGLKAEWLELEITEGIIIKDIKFTMKTLERLKEMGVRVSLDDFGTGFSSLNYLKNFKIDTLKIDSSFVRDINDDNRSTAIVNTIIMLGKNLTLSVTAEGVETETQLQFLKKNGCNEIQGYLYSRPVPPEKFEKLISGGKILLISRV